MTVTAVRGTQGRPLSSIPGSVTIIERDELEEQSTVSNDFGENLTNLVPGLGPSSQSLTNFGQTLRGRDMLILIDGVPQTTPLRDVAKHLRISDPAAVERIEVIRGSVATYGYGATGGIINIITRTGRGEGTRYRTELGVSGALDEGSDGLGGHISQSLEGTGAAADYALTATAETIGSYFDTDGRRIAPDAFGQGGGLADSESFNLQGKLGYRVNANQRLQFSGTYYNIEQDTDFITDANADDPAFAVPGEPEGVDPGAEDLSLTLDYTANEFWDGTLSGQLYNQDYETIFSPFRGTQSKLVSEKADTDNDGDVDAHLPVTRISPPKLVAYGEYAPSAQWDARLQLTHFADRDQDEYAAGFGGTNVDGYTLVDALFSAAAGPGRLRGGINNLLNEDYITALGQVYAADGLQAAPGRGRTFALSYSVSY